MDEAPAALGESPPAPAGPGESANGQHALGPRARKTRRVHRPAPAPHDEGKPAYVGLVTRTIAFVLDAALIDAVAALVSVSVVLVISLLPVSGKYNSVLVVVGAVLFCIWAAAYFIVFWSSTGQTPGDRVMQIRVTRSGGGGLRPRHAIVRLVFLVAAIVP